MPQVIPALLLCVAANAQGTTFRMEFPSEKATVSVPGFVRVEWREPSQEAPLHALRFFDVSEKQVGEFQFNRHVRVIGNKSAGWIAVTDFSGSSESTVIAFRLDHSTRRYDLRVELRKDPKVAALLAENHHTYIEAVSLSSAGEITLKVWGYGDPHSKGFSLHKKIRLDAI